MRDESTACSTSSHASRITDHGARITDHALQALEQPHGGFDQHLAASGLDARVDDFVAAFLKSFMRRNVADGIIRQLHNYRILERRTLFDREPKFGKNFARQAND